MRLSLTTKHQSGTMVTVKPHRGSQLALQLAVMAPPGGMSVSRKEAVCGCVGSSYWHQRPAECVQGIWKHEPWAVFFPLEPLCHHSWAIACVQLPEPSEEHEAWEWQVLRGSGRFCVTTGNCWAIFKRAFKSRAFLSNFGWTDTYCLRYFENVYFFCVGK